MCTWTLWDSGLGHSGTAAWGTSVLSRDVTAARKAYQHGGPVSRDVGDPEFAARQLERITDVGAVLAHLILALSWGRSTTFYQDSSALLC